MHTALVDNEASGVVGGRSAELMIDREALQQARYPDRDALALAARRLRSRPPLVNSWEVEALKAQLAEAAAGHRFVLQGGACAERFEDCKAETITGLLKVMLQMGLVMEYGLQLPVVRIGRLAGQYAKPRSADVESRGGVTLPSYRGDLVNGPGFEPADRAPNPERLLTGYSRAAMTLNFLRSLVEGGFADVAHPEYWELSFVEKSPRAVEYRRLLAEISESVRLIENLTGSQAAGRRVDFFTSHEGLHLHYEQALSRRVPRRRGSYDLSTHFPWIGMRTAQPDGAHVAFFRDVANPIGLKVGPAMTREWLAELLEVLHPEDEPGRLTLITRMGCDQVEEKLPPLIETVQASGKTVLWVCDPMHGNTETACNGYKTRRFRKILSELEQSFVIHAAMGSRLGGMHLELTGEDVTECVGGARGIGEADLVRAYTSPVDPRLNYEQGMELALRVARRAVRTNHRHCRRLCMAR